MIEGYRDLEVYRRSYELTKEILQLTLAFPKEERYEIVSQMRRASLSIPLNIAEGYGKKESAAEFKRFLLIAIGSANEMQVLLDISHDLGYVSAETHQKLLSEYDVLGKRLHTLVKNWE